MIAVGQTIFDIRAQRKGKNPAHFRWGISILNSGIIVNNIIVVW